MRFHNGGARLKENLDIRIPLIVLLIAASTLHVGHLFADREASGWNFVGYMLALAIDGVLARSLYELAKTEGKHRLAALGVFILACLISGGFNVGYYRLYYPTDHFLVSLLLGVAAPGLAAALAVLKALGDVEKTQAESEDREVEFQYQLELGKFEILQKEETKRIEEQEKTKRAKERTKQQQIKIQTEAKAEEASQKERKGMTTLQRRQAIFDSLCQDLDQSPKEFAVHFGVTAQTIRNDLKHLHEQDKIIYKDGRVTLRPQKIIAKS